MTVVFDVKLALAKGIPELDGPVSGPADNLSVVGAEADAQDIRVVANKATGGLSSVEVPKAESVVP